MVHKKTPAKAANILQTAALPLQASTSALMAKAEHSEPPITMTSAASLSEPKKRNASSKKRKKKNRSNPSSPPKPRCPLLTLPTEIRMHIYKHMFGRSYICIETPGYHKPSWQALEINAKGIQDSLHFVSTCSLLRKEALRLLAQSTIIQLEGEGCSWNQLNVSMACMFLVHVEEICLPGLSSRFDLQKMPSLKKVVVDVDAEADFQLGFITEENLDLALSKVATEVVNEFLELMDGGFPGTNRQRAQTMLRNWQMLKQLGSRGVQVEKKFEVYLSMEHDEDATAELELTLNVNTMQVKRPMIVLDHDLNRVPINSSADVLKVLQSKRDTDNDDLGDRSGWDEMSVSEGYNEDHFTGTYDGIPLDALSESMQNHVMSLYW